jgi:hypothetical protein
MLNPDIEALLQLAFRECDAMGHPLNATQQQILFQVISKWIVEKLDEQAPNPLSQLTPDQRQVFLRFVQTQQKQNRDWQTTLLNDWLESRDSGAVQFVRDFYGLPWLRSITPAHLAEYQDEDAVRLNVGDRIEVCNALWEWVQDDGPCSREWFPCVVINVSEGSTLPGATISSSVSGSSSASGTTCTVRFDNGNEFDIQGMYDWNRTNWRTLRSS